MKRLIMVLLLLTLALILSGCGHHGMHGWMVNSGQQTITSMQETGPETRA